MRARELFSLAACLTIFVGGHLVSAQALRAHSGDAHEAKVAAEHAESRWAEHARGLTPGR